MKIRKGFVSNSSTSSFLIYGLYLEDEEINKYFGIKSTVDRDEDDEDTYEAVEKLAEELNMEMHYPEGYDGYYIGRTLQECGDDQTMGDFKKKIRKEFNNKSKEKIPEDRFNYYEEAYYS